MIALADPPAAAVIIRRCRIEFCSRAITGSAQPYHAAARMPRSDAEEFLRSCSDEAAALAQKAVEQVLAELSDHQVKDACLVLSSARPLPGLDAILGSHVMIHTAEGEFYRAALRRACKACGLSQTGISERDLVPEAARALRRSGEELQSAVATFGKAVGPPWGQDQKLAALAAWLVLARRHHR
jgi:hypothetical protein